MSKLPIHIAMIMDGNGRWAQQRQLSRLKGHYAGSQNAIKIIQACQKRNIKVLTLYAFSMENWKRPKTEVTGLLKLFAYFFEKEVTKLVQLNIRIQIIGDLDRFNGSLCEKNKKNRTDNP